MKKTIILLTTMILFGFTAVNALEIVGQLGAGSLAQDGSRPQWIFSAGFEAPIIKTSAKGYALFNQTQYVYADFGPEGFDRVNEVYAIKSYLMCKKYLTLGHCI